MARTTKDFGRIIEAEIASDATLRLLVEREQFNAELALQIYDARKRAGLTQSQLATKVGTQQSAIARLEDSDYSGHSTAMLWKIADALKCRLKIELVPRDWEANEESDLEMDFVCDEWSDDKWPNQALSNLESVFV